MSHLKDGLDAREGYGGRAAEEDEEPPFISRGMEARNQEGVGGEGKFIGSLTQRNSEILELSITPLRRKFIHSQ